ncbi:MAG: DUF3307 domain-containing protein [Candidatus Peribacteraceae bacterium]|nr:DUF3307 domain-containing protein [Candidatus Peribacteraceae bacterium]
MDIGFRILLAHLVGDYILQSHTMAMRKTNDSVWALIHAISYTLPYLFITVDFLSLLVICVTHFFIDRFRLARFVIYAKNVSMHGKPMTSTGYPEEVPAWLSTWLMIITDNTLHLLIGYFAIIYFGVK